MPIDFFFEPPPDALDVTCPLVYVEWMKRAGRETHEFVRQHLKGALIRQKRSYDKKSCIRTFEPGDLVYREYLPQKNEHKFAYPWKGPYIVEEKVGDVNYKIKLPNKGPSVVVHVDQLKSCLIRHLPEQSDAVSSEEEGESDNEPDDVAYETVGEGDFDNEQVEVVDAPENADSVVVDSPAPEVRTRYGRLVNPPDRLGL
jgi:hypothetical protein